MPRLHIIMIAFFLSFPAMTPCSIAQTKDSSFGLDSINDSLYILRIGDNEWRLPYPVYRFETGDINGDGIDEAIVGVIKSTRFSPDIARRVFIFKNYKGFPRALWLGSRLGSPVVDFRYIDSDRSLRLIEEEGDGSFLVVEYRLARFGMTFHRYLSRNKTMEESIAILQQ